MEKIILHHLEWELTVPTCYVFLVRFIKASIPDNEMEKNLVVVVSGEEVSSTKWYLEYLKPLVSKLDTPTDLSQHLALVPLILLICMDIANDKFYANRKTSPQLKSLSKKRNSHGVKVLHSIS
ncbi:hypothetical protein Dimus_003868, partial [Dionaea muscipula]